VRAYVVVAMHRYGQHMRSVINLTGGFLVRYPLMRIEMARTHRDRDTLETNKRSDPLRGRIVPAYVELEHDIYMPIHDAVGYPE